MLFVWVLRWYPLKPMQIQASRQTRSLKPIQKVTTGVFTRVLTVTLTEDSQANPCICMGFKPWWHDLHAICVGFKVVPLKTHANTGKSLLKPLKTHAFQS